MVEDIWATLIKLTSQSISQLQYQQEVRVLILKNILQNVLYITAKFLLFHLGNHRNLINHKSDKKNGNSKLRHLI